MESCEVEEEWILLWYLSRSLRGTLFLSWSQLETHLKPGWRLGSRLERRPQYPARMFVKKKIKEKKLFFLSWDLLPWWRPQVAVHENSNGVRRKCSKGPFWDFLWSWIIWIEKTLRLFYVSHIKSVQLCLKNHIRPSDRCNCWLPETTDTEQQRRWSEKAKGNKKYY